MRDNIIKILVIIFLMFTMNVKADDNLETVEIGQKYYEKLLEAWVSIFPDRNRNAAGPKFFNFALKQSLAIDDFIEYNKLYCAVSGSLIDPGEIPDLVKIYEEETSKLMCGEYYRCCLPCSCDLMKYAKTRKVKFTFDKIDFELNVLTIKDPCQKDNFPIEVNRNYFCKENKLDKNQVFTVDDDLVIGLLHNAAECTESQLISIASNETTGQFCEFRNNQPIEEVKGGMGDIFIQMAN